MIEAEIRNNILNFSQSNLLRNSLDLFKTLGYTTQRQLQVTSIQDFKMKFLSSELNEEKSLYSEWKDAQFLFELQPEDLNSDDKTITGGKVGDKDIQAYWFFAIELKGDNYTKKQLSDITREINKCRLIPIFILFKYADKLTFSIIDRRTNKRDADKDVLQKVVLIKDIDFNTPHRAHTKILNDIVFSNLNVENFVDLHLNWLKKLSVSELNKEFYTELSNWFFWTMDNCVLSTEKDPVKKYEAEKMFVIRMITRIIFNWFIKEKGLLDEKVFNKQTYLNLLKPEYREQGDLYYKVILQNLFFGCLSMPMNERRFRKHEGGIHGQQGDYNVNIYYRYEKYFQDSNKFIELIKNIPFINGGLFECLDDKDNKVIVDCFTDKDSKNFLKIPDYIFFMEEEKIVDISANFDGETKYKTTRVKGLFPILNSYKFTIDETTPVEEEIALDPELLGRVFENLLAAHNPETETTARKSTGSYYTPREIVDYMCEQSLINYLKTKVEHLNIDNLDDKLTELLSYSETQPFDKESEVEVLIKAVNEVKILDPACGSGAFPMGLLHKLVHILSKLDPNNDKWKSEQLKNITDPVIRQEIEEAFKENNLDYSRKLYLIQNCIYGVDIQPMATQISRLRFFISLIVDEKVDKTKDNMGIYALPNLETKFVAANTLIGLDAKEEHSLLASMLDDLKSQLKECRKKYFSAKGRTQKKKLRDDDKNLRDKIIEKAESLNLDIEKTAKLTEWNPYEKDKKSEWFDAKWMFDVEKFDIVIGNPPYIPYKDICKFYSLKNYYSFDNGQTNKPNLFVYFIENALSNLLTESGILSFINPIAFLVQSNCVNIRKLLIKKQICELLDMSYVRIFEDVDTYTVILTIKNALPRESFKYQRYYSIDDINNNDRLEYSTSNIVNDPENKIILSEHLDIVFKINKQRHFVGEFFNVDCGTSEGGFSNKISNTKTSSNMPVLQSSDIQKYSIDWLGYYIEKDLYNEKKTNIFNRTKIVMARMTNHIRCAYDTNKFYCGKINTIITKNGNDNNLKILLALLNSKLVDFLYHETYMALHMQGDAFGFDTVSVEGIKIPDIDTCSLLIEKVDKILETGKNFDKMKEYQDEIDKIVYKLYDLTYEEANIIDPNFSEIMPESEYNKFVIHG